MRVRFGNVGQKHPQARRWQKPVRTKSVRKRSAGARWQPARQKRTSSPIAAQAWSVSSKNDFASSHRRFENAQFDGSAEKGGFSTRDAARGTSAEKTCRGGNGSDQRAAPTSKVDGLDLRARCGVTILRRMPFVESFFIARGRARNDESNSIRLRQTRFRAIRPIHRKGTGQTLLATHLSESTDFQFILGDSASRWGDLNSPDPPFFR